MATEEQDKKRGWIFDQLMIVGSLEASMNHTDEEVCNLYNKLAYEEDESAIQKVTDELSLNREILAKEYANRVDALNQIFDEIPNSNRHYFCKLKHAAATYVMAAENYHARGENPESERILIEAGEALALVCSVAFGFDPMDCLRCVSDSLSGKHQVAEKNIEKTITL